MKSRNFKFNFKFVWILVFVITLSYFLPIFDFTSYAEFRGYWTDNCSEAPPLHYTEKINNVETNIIEITTPFELAWVSANIGSYDGFKGYEIRLTKNIDLSAHYWVPIGITHPNFSGTFDGGNCEIRGLNIIHGGIGGLFGSISYATIKNVVLTTGRIDCFYRAGGLFGEGYSSTISNCYNFGVVVNVLSDGDSSAGGIGGAGSNITYKNCQNFASVYAIGRDSTTCSASAGGIHGDASSSSINATYCYNAGSVTTAGSGVLCFSGGIVGRYYTGEISYCVNYGAIDASYYSRTYTFADGSNSMVTSSSKTEASYCGGIAGGCSNWNYSHMYIINCANYGYTRANSRTIENSSDKCDEGYLDYISFKAAEGKIYLDHYYWINNSSGNYTFMNLLYKTYREETKQTRNTYIGGIVGYSTSNVINCYSEGGWAGPIRESMLTTRYFSVVFCAYGSTPVNCYGDKSQRIKFTVAEHMSCYSGINGNFNSMTTNCFSTYDVENIAPDWFYDEQTLLKDEIKIDYGDHWAEGIANYTSNDIVIRSYENQDDEGETYTLSNYTCKIAMYSGWVDSENYGISPIVKNSLYTEIKGTSSNIQIGYSCKTVYNKKESSVPAQYLYTIEFNEPMIETNYTYSSSSKTASDLGAEWSSDSKFINGKPYPKGLYWEDN